MVARFNDGRRALTSVCEVLPLKEARYYEIQEMFRYELLDDKSGRGGLVWTGKPCVFRDEPKVRLLKDTWGLAERVLRSPAGEDAP